MNEGVLSTVLNMSFTGSIVALMVMAVRVFIRKLPGRYAYLLWAAVGIRLLCPVILETGFSILPVNPEPVDSRIAYEALPTVDSGVFFLDETVNHVLEQTAVPREVCSVNPLQIWILAGTVLWAAGSSLFVFVNFAGYIRLKRRLRTAVLLSESYGQNGAEGAEKNTRWKIYETDEISSPIAAGFFKPAIYIPFGMEKRDREYVILHESIHIRRRDYLVKLAAFLALAVHWFNPMVWLSYFFLCEDMERACDEKVLDTVNKECKAEYSAVLFQFAVKQNRLLLPLAFGESHTKTRVKNILRYRKMSPWAGGLLTAAVLLAGCAMSVDPESLSEMEPEASGDRSISIIGGADGPTSVFLAGKISPDEERISYSPVNMESLSNEVLDKGENTVYLDYVSQVQGEMVFHGPWGIFVYEKNNGKWQVSHSIDMKKVDDSYMAEGKNTKVVPSPQGMFIGNYTSEGWEDSLYYYDFASRELFSDEEFKRFFETFQETFPDYFFAGQHAGPSHKVELLENEEITEKGMPSDYGIYQMEGNHLGLLNSYTDRVLDLWFADVNEETQSITQAYLFHGDGEERVYQEEVRQFLFSKNGYDYYVSLPTEPLVSKGEKLEREGWFIPGRREIIRIDRQGKREVLDNMMISGGSSERMQSPVIMAGDRLIYPGAKNKDTLSFKRESLISIALDGSDRQAAGEDRIRYGTFRSLSLDTSNNTLYFEGWTNDNEFPRPVYKADTRLQNITLVGEIEGNLITVRDGNFYFLHKEAYKQAIAVARLEEGNDYYFYDKCGYNAGEYMCEKAYIRDGKIYMTFAKRPLQETKKEYQVPLADTEKVKEYLD